MKRALLILLCIINLASITYFSSQSAEKSSTLSKAVTQKIIEPIIKKSKQPIDKKTTDKYHKLIRSIAHIALFLTLGILLYLTLIEFKVKWSFLCAFVICFIYAIFDETYQELLNRGRTFEFVDLLKDWSGAFGGITVASLIKLFLSKRSWARTYGRLKKN